ncbi:hypothetical protein AC579_940 [Pseudocercospora musae]|uniref:RRM domain-containing protein n=1 Tax=Pseudocercospora musae TaxID=113226 RepID=A0A139IUD6_9PEZI|nr:hypothetical protein AC579_940 [Pseudocercospora musae]
MSVEGRVRLHITPFNPSLLERYFPESLRSQALNISFHTIETFPEKGFGYVELPAMEAQKLKKKLNGTVLKGSKVKIEEARPQKKRKSEEVEPENSEEDTAVRKKAKKEKEKENRKAGEKVIPGHELEEGRYVKRGWIEDKIKSKKAKKDGAKDGLEGKKMRFKTVVPETKCAEDGKKRKSKDKDKNKSKKEVVVKEFDKSKKPQDGGAKSRKSELKYEEGQGWVNEDGRTVEAEPPNKKRRRERDAAKDYTKNDKKSRNPTREPIPDPIVEEVPALYSEPENSSIELAHASLPTREEWSGDEESVSSSSVSSESSPSPSSSEGEAEMAAENSDAELDAQLARAKSNTVSNKNTPAPDATLGAESSQPVGEPKEVHPLEALFKCPSRDTEKPKTAPIDTSFSFFNPDENEEQDLAVETKVPQTPRTREELEWRSVRSAAPTPDTAAVGKSFDFSFTEAQDEDMRDVPESPVRAHKNEKVEGEKEESEFRKWFYENRGDLNRAWKKRRREERKVGRQRENRRSRR